jgi:hypothetical protein
MKKCILFLVMIMACTLAGQSQNTPDVVNTQPGMKKACCFKISSLSISDAKYMYGGKYRSDKDFDSEKFKIDIYNWDSGEKAYKVGKDNSNNNSRRRLVLEMGLNPYNRKLGDYNKRRELCIGLYYSGSDLENTGFTKYNSIPGDTFSFNSVIYRTDTLTRTRNSYIEDARVLGASVQYLYKTNPEKRFSLFTGYGIDAGYAITAWNHRRYTCDTAVLVNFYSAKPDFGSFENGTYLGTSDERSSIKADPTIFAGVFVPFGVNFRLCKKKEIWNQMNLFVAGKLGMETKIIAGGKVQFEPLAGGNFGFKFDFK